ncbi:hypothetical protein VspSw1_18 [Vibrio phage VspSw_1]|uniref:Uncharacterized protein n=1 Tax=Vibrio phage VspSw_1 TaxID=2484249 RepID=A0A411BKK9_9CAUD|nr:hypothetical protein HOV08_gp018 [Vibrio phage VspSw_1]QAY02092.1 hypothetical protein VspSw1_18 [Vibrio phage VspSw_1]
MKNYDLSELIKTTEADRLTLIMALGGDGAEADATMQMVAKITTFSLAEKPLSESDVLELTKALTAYKNKVTTSLDTLLAIVNNAPVVELTEESTIQSAPKKYH